jgi:hypothetical protein
MKNTLRKNTWLLAAAAGLLVQFSASPLLAQTPRPFTNIVLNTFMDILDVPYTFDNGPAGTTTLDWSSNDADGSGSSGSMLCSVGWVDTTGGWQEAQFGYENPFEWPGLVMAPWYKVEFDVQVVSGDAGTDGNYGRVQVVVQGWDGAGQNGTSAGWNPLGQVSLTPAYLGTWQHVTQVLTPVQAFNMNKIVLDFVGQNVTNTINYLVDNVEFTVPSGPAPTLSLAPAAGGGGLAIVTAAGTFSREQIRTVGTNFAWYGAGSPVTYSFTIAEQPPEPYTGFQTHLFLIANAPNNTFPDYAAANVLRFDLNNGVAGAGTGTLRYKTNSASGNGGFYTDVSAGGGQYPGVPSANVLGTWSLTFSQNTNVTVSAPDGTSSNYVISAEAAAFFNSPDIHFYVGAMANQATNLGQRTVISEVNVTGTGGGIAENFPGSELNTNTWQNVATTPANVFVQPSDIAYELSWPQPDNLFTLATSPDLTNLTNATLSVVVGAGSSSANVPKNYPSAAQGFFALINREPTKLQVLLPGETPAPGTPAGKTGAPIVQTAGNAFQVVVNAVDDNWNLAFSADEVYLASSAGTNDFSFGFAEELIHGTYSYTVTNLTAGSWTITALDTTDTNITEYTTGSYTVDP